MIVIASLRIQRYTSQLVESSDVLYYAEGRQLYLKMIHLVSSLLENLRDFSAGFTTFTVLDLNFLQLSRKLWSIKTSWITKENILNGWKWYLIFTSLLIINIQKHYRIRLCGPELEESSKYGRRWEDHVFDNLIYALHVIDQNVGTTSEYWMFQSASIVHYLWDWDCPQSVHTRELHLLIKRGERRDGPVVTLLALLSVPASLCLCVSAGGGRPEVGGREQLHLAMYLAGFGGQLWNWLF